MAPSTTTPPSTVAEGPGGRASAVAGRDRWLIEPSHEAGSLHMNEYGDGPDAALEAGDTAEAADDLGDGMSRTIDIDGSAQQSDR